MNPLRRIAIAVIVFLFAIVGLLWSALNKATVGQHSAKAPLPVAERFCRRLELSDDLDMLGYEGCRIEMDLRGVKLLRDQRLELGWGFEVRKGPKAEQLVQDDALGLRVQGSGIARGGDEGGAPGKVELAVIYRREPQTFEDIAGHHPSDQIVGRERIRLDGRTFSGGQFAAVAPALSNSIEVIPFRYREFPLNEPFTAIEYVFTLLQAGKEIEAERITLRWSVKFTIASNQSSP